MKESRKVTLGVLLLIGVICIVLVNAIIAEHRYIDIAYLVIVIFYTVQIIFNEFFQKAK